MPSTEPVASVIMIFRDAARFIDEAIRSVETQTLADWELVLVDDGSTDEGPALAAAHQARLGGRVRLLRHEGGARRGTGPSRNLGMEAARGRYVSFLDADDVYEPRRLEAHVRCLDSDPALGVVLGPDLYWRSWQTPATRSATWEDRVIGPAVTPGRRIEAPALAVATLLTRGAPVPASCSLTFRTEVVRRLGGIPDSFTAHYEDQALVCKLLLEYPAIVIEECLARYRQHPASLTQGNAPLESERDSPAWQARVRFLEWLRAHVAERHLDIPDLDAWVSRELGRMRALPPRSTVPSQTLGSPVSPVAIGRLVPRKGMALLDGLAQRLRSSITRRRVMARIERIENSGKVLDARIRRYWNERIHDTRLSDDLPGSAGFFAALDAYRLRKCEYLPRTIDFAGWAGRDVLEIGCGAGLDLVRFARGGARTIGVDVAESALSLARQYCRVTGVDARLLEADGAKLPLSDASFDLVYCHGVLSFVRDPAAVIAEALRVLRPGGEAILMVYNRRSWMRPLLGTSFGARIGQGHADAPAFRAYTCEEFEGLLAAFAERRFLVERLPTSTTGQGGLVGALFNRGVVPIVRALPDRWLRPWGWHLLAFCRKAER